VSQNNIARGLAATGLLWLLAALPSGQVLAQDNDAIDATGATRPIATATRISSDEAPSIDGDISDAIWARATPIEDFDQLEPDDAAAPSERTIARILYDENNIYFSFYAYDSDPSGISANLMSGPYGLSADDFVRVFLDPSRSRRNAYLFEVNPIGARSEAVIQNNTDFIFEWSTVWGAKARIVEDGWTAEIVIPFRSISYDHEMGDWGLEMMRLVRRKSERIRWANPDNALFSTDVSRAGTMRSIEGTSQGMGLDAIVYGSLVYKHDWRPATREDDVTFEPSANIFYKITPALTGTLTLNTDFSDTPLDERQVNTSRFSLFFPETREFFLQDVALFEFGGGALEDVNGSPFFSRRIGLANGEPVNLNAGLKLSGVVGDVSLGALSVWADGPAGEDPRLLSVLRASMPVGESKAGIILTNGDPVGDDDNTVLGFDYQYRNSQWVEGMSFRADFYYQRSFSALAGDDDSFGLQFSQTSEPFTFEINAQQIGENFNPALGFVNRPAIRELNGDFAYRYRTDGGDIRWYEIGSWFYYVTDLDGNLETRENGVWAGFLTSENTELFVNLMNAEENLPFGFFLPDSVFIPAGDYEWWQVSLNHGTSDEHEFSYQVNLAYADGFFDGVYTRANFGITWRPSEHFSISPRWNYQKFDMPDGKVEIHIAFLNGTIDFTPDSGMIIQAQWDNISQAMGASIRYRWEYEPGSEFFAAIAEGAHIDEETYESHVSGASIRIGHLFRY